MVEALESRLLFAGPAIDVSTVGLYSPNGTAAGIDRTQGNIWFVIHGLYSSKNEAGIQQIASAVDAALPGSQVRLIDWGDLASAPLDNPTAVQHAWAAADAIAVKVRAAHIRSSRVNIIGFSMGGLVEDRLAADLHGVNRVIAIDPAAPPIGVDRNGNPILARTNFAKNSKYSIAFYGASYIAASLSATDTVELTGLAGSQIEQHIESFAVVNTMMRRNAGLESSTGDGVSGLFSLRNILDGNLPVWRKNTYAPGFEARLSCAEVSGSSPVEFGPVQLTYVDRHGQTRQPT